MIRNSLSRGWVVSSLMIFSLAATACQNENSADSDSSVQADAERASLAGVYLTKSRSSRLDLDEDGTFGLRLDGEFGKEPLVRGTWHTDATTISLLADKPEEGRELFTLMGRKRWNSDAEQRLQESELRQDYIRVYQACPFARFLNEGILIAINDIGYADATAKTQAKNTDSSDEESRLRQSLLSLEAMSNRASLSISQAVGSIQKLRSDPNSGALISSSRTDTKLANEAVLHYVEQYESTGRAFAIAGRMMPLSEKMIPRISFVDCLGDEQQEIKQEGYAVVIESKLVAGSMGNPLVDVDFVFSDGTHERRTTDSGWALVPSHKDAVLRELVLQDRDGLYPMARMTMPMERGDIFTIKMDMAAVIFPPFDKVVFDLEKGELVSPQYQWRYIRDSW